MKKVTVAVQPGEGHEPVDVHHMSGGELVKTTKLDVNTNDNFELASGDTLIIGDLPEEVAAETGPSDTNKDGEIDELEALSNKQLAALAEQEEIDLGDAKKKADVIAAIKAARAAKAAAPDPEAPAPEAPAPEGQGEGGQGQVQ